MSVFIRQSSTRQSGFKADGGWVILSAIEAQIKAKIEAVGTPLKDWDINIYRGILTGYNEAFIIDQNTRDKLIEASPKSAEIIRPILLGKNIKRYQYEWDNLWVILTAFGSHQTLKSKYPSIYNYLLQFQERLEMRGQCRYTTSGKISDSKNYPGQHHWLELDNNPSADYLSFFDRPKIAWGNLALKSQFSLIEPGLCINAPSVFIATDNLYLLAVLNSKLGEYYIKKLGVSRSGGYFEFKPMYVSKLPVPKVDNETQQVIIKYVERLLAMKKDGLDVTEIENRIDHTIYDLYNISTNDRILIEASINIKPQLYQ